MAPGARTSGRSCAVLAWAGAAALIAGTVLHPSQAEPRDAVAAFTEYTADSRGMWWVAHLLQLVGVVGLVLAVLSATALTGLPAAVRQATRALGAAGIGLGLALQGVDGVALKAMVDLWAGAAGAERETLFAAALGVRQVEIGLDAAMLATTVSGLGGIAFIVALGLWAWRVSAGPDPTGGR